LYKKYRYSYTFAILSPKFFICMFACFLQEDERFVRFRNFRVTFPVSRKGNAMVLALGWTCGLVFGCILYLLTGPFVMLLMRGVLHGTVSIVSLLTSLLLPFLIAAFAVYISRPWLLILFGTAKACLLSFVSLGILLCYGSAGWLLRLMLMFSDLIGAVLLYGFISRHLRPGIRFCAGEVFALTSLCVLVGSIYFVYILPFLADMIYF